MPRIYDLGVKFAGLAGLCGTPVPNTMIGAVLYEHLNNEKDEGGEIIAQYVSRLRAGEKSLEAHDADLLSAHFNKILSARFILNEPSARSPIRGEDWSHSVPEFFADITRFIDDDEALDRAHHAIIEALRALDPHCDRAAPLIIARHVGQEADLTRFPVSAVPVDTLTLSPVHLRAGQEMLIELPRPPNRPSKGWLFFVRNPDIRRNRTGITERIWDQKPGDLIRWHSSPFPIPADHDGPLSGYPASVANVEGEFTAYLFVEAAAGTTVQRELEKTGGAWDTKNPSLEATLHLIARGKAVFAGGAAPQLLVRRYRVSHT